MEFCLQMRVTPLRLAPCRTGCSLTIATYNPSYRIQRRWPSTRQNLTPLLYCVTASPPLGEKTLGIMLWGQRFIACPLYLQRSHGGQTVGENFKNKLTGLNQISVPISLYNRLLIVFFKTGLYFQYKSRFLMSCMKHKENKYVHTYIETNTNKILYTKCKKYVNEEFINV